MRYKNYTNYSTFTLLLLLTILSVPTHAQSWQWGKRGGSATTGSGGPDETVVDMTTDKKGNLYVLSTALQSSLNVDGHSLSNYGGQDILITSFSCNGTYRWSKLIGTAAGETPVAIKTDTLNGVYVTGAIAAGYSSFFSTDTTLPVTNKKTLFLIKYDTSGTYQWLRMPQSDTVFYTISSTRSLDLSVDGAGNSYWMCMLPPAAYVNGTYNQTASGVHILKYSSAGNFQGGTQLAISYTSLAASLLKMARDNQNGNYYITGTLPSTGGQTLTIGTTTVASTLFLGCFNNNGALNWLKQGSGYGAFNNRAAVDLQSNVYITGGMVNGTAFNGYTAVNTLSTLLYGFPAIIKLDVNGNNIWGKNASCTSGSTFSYLTLTSTGNPVVACDYPGKIKWAGFTDSLSHIPNQGTDVFITKFDPGSGNVLKMDSLGSSFGVNEYTTAITADNNGNVYLGGNLNANIIVNGTTLSSIGGGSDFFFAKYGTANCSCTVPVSAFTNTGGTGHSLSFTYTGTTPVDSVVWNFGDNTATAQGLTVTHNYTTRANYTVCATAYTACGSNQFCKSVAVATAVSNTVAFKDVQLYPNPATNQLTLEHAAGMEATLTGITGQQLRTWSITNNTQTLFIGDLPAGLYLLQLSSKEGEKIAVRVVKQ